MDSPVTLFQKLLEDNNLSVTIAKPQIRFIENGGVIVEQPLLTITFTNPTLAVVDSKATPDAKVTDEPSTGDQVV
jgi:hypothetical protein